MTISVDLVAALTTVKKRPPKKIKKSINGYSLHCGIWIAMNNMDVIKVDQYNPSRLLSPENTNPRKKISSEIGAIITNEIIVIKLPTMEDSLKNRYIGKFGDSGFTSVNSLLSAEKAKNPKNNQSHSLLTGLFRLSPSINCVLCIRNINQIIATADSFTIKVSIKTYKWNCRAGSFINIKYFPLRILIMEEAISKYVSAKIAANTAQHSTTTSVNDQAGCSGLMSMRFNRTLFFFFPERGFLQCLHRIAVFGNSLRQYGQVFILLKIAHCTGKYKSFSII